MTAEFFCGIFAPANTPKAIIDRVNLATQKLLREEDFQSKLRGMGYEVVPDSGPDRSDAFIREEQKRWTPIVRGARKTNPERWHSQSSLIQSQPQVFERSLHLGGKKLFRLQEAMTNALLIGILKERLQSDAVRFDAVRPQVSAEKIERLTRVFVEPWDWICAYSAKLGALNTATSRFVERGEQIRSQPRMPFSNLGAHSDGMHDREDTGGLYVRHLLGKHVVKQPSNVPMTLAKTPGRRRT